MKTCIFLRNDDVRGPLDSSLMYLTEKCIENSLPITHAVEPANVTPKVVDWLLCMKRDYPKLVEIIQHGFDHSLEYTRHSYGHLYKGEFGGDQTYSYQKRKIEEGMNTMDDLFGDNWFRGFTFPFGARNEKSIRVLIDLGFLVVNGGVGTGIKRLIFDKLGRALNRELLFGKKVSWNLKHRNGSQLMQIDVSISVITKYINNGQEALFLSKEEFSNKVESLLGKIPNIGILFHHRFHDTPDKLLLIDQYIDVLKHLSDVQFMTQEGIYNLYDAK